MQVNGVPPKGKELELFPGLTLHLPFGVAYARDEDGNMNLIKPRTSPKLYRDGPFELDDGAETTWKINSLRSLFSGTIEAPRAEAAKAVEESLEDAARSLTEDQDQSESDEDRYTFGTEEGEGGLTFQANFSTAQAGGSYEKPVTRGDVTLCVVHQRMRVMGFHITVSHLLIGVVDYPQMRYYLAGLDIPDEDRRGDILKREIFPLLYALQFTAPPSLSDLLGKTPEELFPAAVQGLDFAAGEQVEAGEFTVTIPKGLHYTRTENPETRYFTAVPQEIPFDAENFWDYSAIALTLQTGAPIVNIHAPLDTADGEKEVELILQAMSISDSSSAGQTTVGKTTRAARSPDHYICYELIDDNDVDMNFRYYVFTKNFLYAGQYVGKKAGLGPDCSKTHTGILETYLQSFRYAGGSEKLLEDAVRRALGRFAGSDGRMDALKAVQLFNEDVLFFPDGVFSWDGTHHVFTGIHLNAEKMEEYPDVKDHLEEIGTAVQALVNECEQDERLRVPAAKLGAGLRNFLNGADLTGAALFHLAAYHLFWFKEDEETPGQFSLLIDTRLKASVPDAENYFKRLLEILRAYNGDPAPVVSGPALIFRAMDIPDIFEDGGPCLAEHDENGYLKRGPDGDFDFIPRQKTPEELAWEARMAKEAAEAELAKVPFDRVSSVTVSGRAFVLTGDFEKNPEDRDVVKRLIEAKGGRCTGTVSGKTNYLVVGALGGFGERKIEHVQEQRAKGKVIKIIREADLMAALEGRTPPAPKPASKPAPKPAPQPASKPAPQPAPTVQKASEETAARARIIEPVLSDVPMTTAEINAALGTDYTALQVAVAVKLISGVGTTTVKRRTFIGGVNTEKDYTAYYLNAKPAASSAVDVERQRRKAQKAREATHRKAVDDAKEQRRKEQEAAYNKAVEALKADVQKIIKEGREAADKQKEEVQSLQQKKSSAEQKLKQLGFFSFSEKKAVKAQIAQLAKEIGEAEQKLEGLKREARKKAEKTLEKHRLPLPPALLGGSKSASESARRSASGDAAERAQKIEGVLSILPMTAKEINAALGTDYTALQIANAVKLIPSACTDKVFRIETDKDGNPMLRELTAYCSK